MSNCVFGWPIYSDPGLLYTPALSGGSWSPSLPLSNAQDRRLTRVARSASALASATQLEVDLRAARPVRVAALLLPNISAAGTVRVRGRTNQAAVGPYLSLPGVSGSTAQASASPAFAGDLDVRARFSVSNWTAPAATVGVVAKHGVTSPTRSWLVRLDISGKLLLSMTNAAGGFAITTVASTVANTIPPGSVWWVRCTWRASDGRTQFFTSPDGATWTQLGADVTLAVTSNGGGTQGIEVGSHSNGTGDMRVMTMYRAQVMNGIDGAAMFDADFSYTPSFRPGNTSITDRAGGTVVTLFGTATLAEVPAYDSGTVTVWPAGQTVETMDGLTPVFVGVTPAAANARYWLFEVSDPANPSGYVDVARAVVSGGWQPTINMSYGAQLGLETESERSFTDGGAAVYTVRPRRRTLQFDIRLLPEAEAMDGAFDMQRLAGIDKQLFFVFDPADTGKRLQQRAFLATLRTLSAVEYAYFNFDNVPFQLTEEL